MALLRGPLTILRHSVMAKSPVSINQYISHIPGCLPNTMGWEATKDQYRGGTLFVNHASGFIFIKHQVSLSAGETLIGRCQFEQYALQLSITIESYHAGNALFSSSAITKAFTACGQTISFSGVGAHHQNGTTKQNHYQLGLHYDAPLCSHVARMFQPSPLAFCYAAHHLPLDPPSCPVQPSSFSHRTFYPDPLFFLFLLGPSSCLGQPGLCPGSQA